jgi:hypothetical protein
VSNKLSTLVWGAKSFASGRSGLAQRLIMASLADQVDEVRHRDFCYPSFAVIGERTELSRRCVIDALGKLTRNGWLKVEQKPGYGNLYRFDTHKLAGHQREKPERSISRTRAYLAPVQDTALRGASYAGEGCNLALTNKEESAVKPAEEPASPLRVMPTARPAKKAKALEGPFVLPAWIDPELWDAHQAVRRKKRAAETTYALNLLVAELAKFRAAGHDPDEALRKSIRSGWSDVFEPQKQGQWQNSPTVTNPVNAIDKIRGIA